MYSWEGLTWPRVVRSLYLGRELNSSLNPAVPGNIPTAEPGAHLSLASSHLHLMTIESLGKSLTKYS